MRIAIGGFQHESHSFAPRPTAWMDFVKPGGFPPVQHAATLLDTLRPTGVPSAGAIAAAEAEGVDLVPLAWAFANPAGPVTREAFERITALIVAALSDALDAGPLDGVYLELHGAMVSEDFPDAEGEVLRRVRAVVGLDVPIAASLGPHANKTAAMVALSDAMQATPLDGVYLELHGAMVSEDFPDAEGEVLRRVRAVVGPDLPIAVSLDPHANKTAAMVAHSDVLVPYRTYPHIDMKPAGAQAMRLLLRMIREGRRPAKAFRELDYWTPLPGQCTMVAPMAEVMAERARLGEAAGVWEVGFCFGFPYADFPGCGMAIASYADTP